jgi:hypothetical protein
MQAYNETACDIVKAWNLLPDIVFVLNPKRDNNTGAPGLGQVGSQKMDKSFLSPSSTDSIVFHSTIAVGLAIVALHFLNYFCNQANYDTATTQ